MLNSNDIYPEAAADMDFEKSHVVTEGASDEDGATPKAKSSKFGFAAGQDKNSSMHGSLEEGMATKKAITSKSTQHNIMNFYKNKNESAIQHEQDEAQHQQSTSSIIVVSQANLSEKTPKQPLNRKLTTQITSNEEVHNFNELDGVIVQEQDQHEEEDKQTEVELAQHPETEKQQDDDRQTENELIQRHDEEKQDEEDKLTEAELVQRPDTEMQDEDDKQTEVELVQRPDTEMSITDIQSQATINNNDQRNAGIAQDIQHAFSYESMTTRDGRKIKQRNAYEAQQRTSTNTMIFDPITMSGFQPIDSFEPSFNVSGSVVITEKAPSEKALISIEQQGVQMISTSSVAIIEGDDGYAEQQEQNEVEEDYKDGQGQDEDQLSPQIDVQRDSMNSSLGPKSQEGLPDKEKSKLVQSTYFDKHQDSLGAGAGSQPSDLKVLIAAASDRTEKNNLSNQNSKKVLKTTSLMVIKKDSTQGVSSENSLYQNTRSAVDRGNLEQRCTDQSEGRVNPENESHDSNYYQDVEIDEDQEQISISKQVILENDEFFNQTPALAKCVVNADLIHITSADKNRLSYNEISNIPQAQENSAIDELVERSKESTENGAGGHIQHPGPQQPEQLRSMKQISSDYTPLGLSTENEACTSQQRQSLKNISTYHPRDLIEMTPQFHGSSPLILDSQTEETKRRATNNQPDQQQYQNQQLQQPNYESDTAEATNQLINSQQQIMNNQQPHLDAAPYNNIAQENDMNMITSGVDVVINTKDAQTTQNNEIVESQNNYELQQSLNILPGSDEFDPQMIQSSKNTTDSKTIRTTQALQDDEMIRIITNIQIKPEEIDQEKKAEVVMRPQLSSEVTTFTHLEGRSARSLGQVDQNRYKIVEYSNKNSNENSREIHQTQRESSTKLFEKARVSSRFSKGKPDVLDKVADRINNSLLLNSQSNCEENMPVYLEQEPSLEHEHHSFQHKISDSSADLPKGLLITNNQQKQQPQQTQTEATVMAKRPPSQIQEELNSQMFVQEQISPSTPTRHKDSSLHSRRSSRFNEPRFPDPVEEVKQRFSTPRRGSSLSPMSSFSPKNRFGNTPTRNGSQNAKMRRPDYPVIVGKNKVIRGPVLKSNYDKFTIQNGRLQMAFKRRRKTTVDKKPASQDESEKDKDEEAGGSIMQAKLTSTIDGKVIGKPRPSQQTAQCELPSMILPKKRIKPGKSSNAIVELKSTISAQDHQQSKSRDRPLKSRDKSRQKSSRSPMRNQMRTQARINLLNAKKEIRTGSLNPKMMARRRDLPTSKTPNTYASVFKRNEVKANDLSAENLLPLAPSNDMSINSGHYSGQGAQSFFTKQHFDKKTTPRYPQVAKMEKSTLEIGQDSSVFQAYAGISKQAVDNLPVDQLYQMMSKNWNREKVAFELKCKKLLETNNGQEESLPQSDKLIAASELARDRQHRFEELRQRLLVKGTLNKRNGSLKDTSTLSNNQNQLMSLTQEQATLNEKMCELEEAFNHSQELVSGKRAKPMQYGNFQLIFNKPDDFRLPSSSPPNVIMRPFPSAHQSHNQIHHPYTLGNNENRQKSQQLTPKIQSFVDIGSVNQKHQDRQRILAMNITPEQIKHVLDAEDTLQPEYQTKSEKTQNANMYKTASNFMSKKRKGSEPYTVAAPNSPHLLQQPRSLRMALNIQQEYHTNSVAEAHNNGNVMVRAATANNQNSQRPPVLITDAFKSSKGFQSSASVKKRIGTGNKGMRKITIHKSNTNNHARQTNKSPNPSQGGNANDDQVKLIQKLQYRSMRGRRIKDYLEKVQSEKRTQATPLQGPSEHNQPVSVNMYPAKIHIIDSHFSDHHSDLRKQMGTQVHSSSSFNRFQDEYGATSNPSFPTKAGKLDKFKSSQGLASDDGSSLDQIESKPDLHKHNFGTSVNSAQHSEILAAGSSATHQNETVPPYQQSQTTVLNNFLAQQDKRIDFGLCRLYKKVRDGQSLEIQTSRDEKILKFAELESLISFIKQKNVTTKTNNFQLRAHQECFNTIQKLMNEIGMGYRAQRMQREESQITVERIYVLACRAHKLHKARIELVQIFDQIIQLEDMLPKVKQQIMSKLAESDKANQVHASSSFDGESSIELANETIKQLEVSAAQLKTLLSQLVVNIPQLLETFKFFNNSFVFNDKDYLKYLSKEANEIKGLFGVYNIRF